MPVLLLILLLGVLAFLWWRRSTTTLTRNCRWRQDRKAGQWRCNYCGATLPDTGKPPVDCLNPVRG
ncbi:hypothetical protein ACMU_14870 [Actibacterium mucosum KCTC 23349]|uniref:Uncharacterized protein n=1 Tax=Actibacterium mucosum KCTC 23349 TaxID=1454373 RepID=A0A037ZJP0_9RHOB|nr:hypothetical protein [Actibacterium mucosum]KAJ55036.1 hypothetical protein ACMU_14870 [Actibacterium mucosum KCTC 23349]